MICHGWVTSCNSNYVHAWLEVGEHVFDYTKSRQPLDKEDYYLSQGIEGEVIRYSFVEFCKLAIEFGNFGPWDKTLT